MQEVHTALTTGASLEYQVQILGHCNSVLHSTCMLLIAVVKRLWVLCPWPLGVVNEVPRCGKLIAYISIRNSVGLPTQASAYLWLDLIKKRSPSMSQLLHVLIVSSLVSGSAVL
jgi:hypothetical protein